MNVCGPHCDTSCAFCLYMRHDEKALWCTQLKKHVHPKGVCDYFTCHTLGIRCPSCLNSDLKLLNTFTLLTDVDAQGNPMFPDPIYCGDIRVNQQYVCTNCGHAWDRITGENNTLDDILQNDWRTVRDGQWGYSRILETYEPEDEEDVEVGEIVGDICPACEIPVMTVEIDDYDRVICYRYTNRLVAIEVLSRQSSLARQALEAGCGRGECYCPICGLVWLKGCEQ